MSLSEVLLIAVRGGGTEQAPVSGEGQSQVDEHFFENWEIIKKVEKILQNQKIFLCRF